MKRLIPMIVLLGAPLALVAGEAVDQILAAEPSDRVEVNIIRGDIKLSGWDQPQVKITGTLDDEAEALVFEREGDEIIIKVELPQHTRKGKGSVLSVQVPRTVELDIKGVSTDFSLSGTSGPAEIKTISGDLKLQQVSAPVEASSISGDISVTRSSGPLEASSVSGDIKLRQNGEQYELASVSGDIELDAGRLKQLEAASVSGDIRVSGSLTGNAKVSLESVSGDISLVLGDDINARLNLETGPGGNIRNGITEDKPAGEEFTGAEALSLRLGSGESRVNMETFSGDLRISR